MTPRFAIALLVAFSIRCPTAALAEPSGQQLYQDACASCHGVDGKGAPEGSSIAVPLPDFSDCNTVTREADADWGALATHGGAFLGMSPQMPAFGDVLAPDEIQTILDYIRGFCDDPSWPRGELNFPRPVFVTKAFPEDEAVVAPSFTQGTGERSYDAEISVETRVGARGQVELSVPLSLIDPDHRATVGGFGDLAVAYKHVLYASLPHQTIFSIATDLVVPSGDRGRGLGDGTTTFEPAVLGGNRLPGGFVLQTQFRAVLPIDVNRAARYFLYRFALQYPLGARKNALVPALEFESAQKIAGAFHDYTVLAPTLYVPLSKRGHLAIGFGGQIPVSDRRPFDYRLGAFFLWDYLDGGLWW
ncbi:MAG TPA: c-type cytochrome [Candidatus Kryptonia bacterium]|nr:c-type cytochrome [Candidatus Kryptonia bacterium]